MMYGLEHLDPAQLSRSQRNKAIDRCKQMAELCGETSGAGGSVQTPRSSGGQFQHLNNRSSEDLWFEGMEILDTVRLDVVPKQAFAAMRTCMEGLDRDIKTEELRRYRESWSPSPWSRYRGESPPRECSRSRSPPSGKSSVRQSPQQVEGSQRKCSAAPQAGPPSPPPAVRKVKKEKKVKEKSKSKVSKAKKEE